MRHSLAIWLSILQPSHFAEVRRHDGLRATPDKEEESFAAPAAGGMAEEVAGTFGGGQRGLRGSQNEAVGSSTDRFACAWLIAGGQGEEVGLGFIEFAAEAGERFAKVGSLLGFASQKGERGDRKCERQS